MDCIYIARLADKAVVDRNREPDETEYSFPYPNDSLNIWHESGVPRYSESKGKLKERKMTSDPEYIKHEDKKAKKVKEDELLEDYTLFDIFRILTLEKTDQEFIDLKTRIDNLCQ